MTFSGTVLVDLADDNWRRLEELHMTTAFRAIYRFWVALLFLAVIVQVVLRGRRRVFRRSEGE